MNNNKTPDTGCLCCSTDREGSSTGNCSCFIEVIVKFKFKIPLLKAKFKTVTSHLSQVEEEREDYQYCSPSLIEHKPEKKYLSDSAEDTPREKDIENKDNRTCCATVTVTVLKMKHSNLNEDFRILPYSM
ncbi:hypothetical protein Anapl_13780 [Anas platyrhynchos]|uniref:Uncharacterized protein n=1 Tax=Anas platyrhynchos TaxID=8839 RepID=R0LIK6_ANAPL|nr:hypothetical protein Anapl_13780 [Anas platyrhynchos]